MYRFIVLLFITLFSTNSFSFKLAPQDDGRVIIYNDAGNRIAAFPRKHFNVKLTNSRKNIVEVRDKSGKLIKEFRETRIKDSTQNSSATPSRTKRTLEDPQTPPSKRSNSPHDTASSSSESSKSAAAAASAAAATVFNYRDYTAEELEPIDEFEARAIASSSTSAAKAGGSAAAAAALKAVEDSCLPSTATTSSPTSPVKGGGAAGAAVATVVNTSPTYVSPWANEMPEFERIMGKEDHISELIDLIDSSEERVEIFSKTLGWLPEKLFNSLKEAAERGVNIILTVQEVKNHYTQNSSEDLGIQVNSGRKTHTKFAIADSHTTIVGSFNFLGQNNYNNEGDENGESSIKVTNSPNLINKIRARIYADMIKYEQRGKKLSGALHHQFSDKTIFHLLTNLDHHEEFFKCMMKQAQEKIVIYSPFIRKENAQKRLKTIQDYLGESVAIEIRVKADQRKFLDWALRSHPQLKKRIKISEDDSHRKSLIVDPGSSKPFVCEGSFNWLSAATTNDSEYCNQETSIVLQGPEAALLLEEDER